MLYFICHLNVMHLCTVKSAAQLLLWAPVTIVEDSPCIYTCYRAAHFSCHVIMAMFGSELLDSVAPDGLHPNSEGMGRLAACITPLVYQHAKAASTAAVAQAG